jgi:hypothetical protein
VGSFHVASEVDLWVTLPSFSYSNRHEIDKDFKTIPEKKPWLEGNVKNASMCIQQGNES